MVALADRFNGALAAGAGSIVARPAPALGTLANACDPNVGTLGDMTGRRVSVFMTADDEREYSRRLIEADPTIVFVDGD